MTQERSLKTAHTVTSQPSQSIGCWAQELGNVHDYNVALSNTTSCNDGQVQHLFWPKQLPLGTYGYWALIMWFVRLKNWNFFLNLDLNGHMQLMANIRGQF